MKTVVLKPLSQDEFTEIKDGNRSALREIYARYRPAFCMWAVKSYKIDEEIAGEVYQRAYTMMYYNIKENKVTEMTSSLKTYLFAIGKNLLRDHYKKSAKFTDLESVGDLPVTFDTTILDKYEQDDMKGTVKRLLEKIGEPCKKVLELYYFREFSLESIAAELNYKTEQIAAKRKFICLQQLRTMINN